MGFARVIIILAFVGSTLIATSQAENSTSTSTTTAASTTTSTTTSTTAPTSTTKVPDRPIKEPGCYWTPCKSPLTYDLKCPPETEEQNENDEMPCEGIFLKYQCCPRKKVVTPEKPKPADTAEGGDKVVPQGV